jgi:hypothetical protein
MAHHGKIGEPRLLREDIQLPSRQYEKARGGAFRPAVASVTFTLCSTVKRWNIALIAGAGARSICTCSTAMCAFQSCATVQAVDKAASPAPVLISGNKTLRMAMI